MNKYEPDVMAALQNLAERNQGIVEALESFNTYPSVVRLGQELQRLSESWQPLALDWANLSEGLRPATLEWLMTQRQLLGVLRDNWPLPVAATATGQASVSATLTLDQSKRRWVTRYDLGSKRVAVAGILDIAKTVYDGLVGHMSSSDAAFVALFVAVWLSQARIGRTSGHD